MSNRLETLVAAIQSADMVFFHAPIWKVSADEKLTAVSHEIGAMPKQPVDNLGLAYTELNDSAQRHVHIDLLKILLDESKRFAQPNTINTTPQVWNDNNLHQQMLDTLAEYAPTLQQQVTLELTEHDTLTDKALALLGELDWQWAIDDVGSLAHADWGYLETLCQVLKPTKFKLDGKPTWHDNHQQMEHDVRTYFDHFTPLLPENSSFVLEGFPFNGGTHKQPNPEIAPLLAQLQQHTTKPVYGQV